MKNSASLMSAAALVTLVVLAGHMQRGKAQLIVPGDSRYQTGCEAVDVMTVEGFVKNPGTGIIRINGDVLFRFTVANAMSRPSIQVKADALIPSGRTVSVARARVATSLLPGEVCQFDVSGAVR
ncbi:MAG: hypothetical protein M0D55_06725 [Elusimicrobiota bacterium]|nr:MAG: hypothetical protein M0D55_06725 [Elusimicrobiota bacterium]